MNIQNILLQGLRRVGIDLYRLLDRLYLPQDRRHLLRTRNIRLIPGEANRRGGKYAYAEWAHVIGIFQTLMFLLLPRKENNRILDIGCGTGLLAIASEPFLGDQGKYTGIDVMQPDIDFCRGHYPAGRYEFIHFAVANPTYAPEQDRSKSPWPVESGSIDLLTALSVWTHLSEEDALFYFREISRVLKPDGRAMVTFFLLDRTYRESLGRRSEQEGRFHMTSQNLWIFDQPTYGSDAWYHLAWIPVPEDAIGVTEQGIDRLCAHAGLQVMERHQGNWKEVPGVFFQDVLIFRKA